MDVQSLYKLAIDELDAVYRLAYYLVGASDKIDDAVQETYLRAFQAADNFQLTTGGIRPWLFKILHNVLHTQFTQNQRERLNLEQFQAQNDSPSHEGEASANADPAVWSWDNIDERLKAAIIALPAQHRSAFLLSAVEGLKYREIAEITGVPIGTVMSRLARARAALAAQLSDLASERRIDSRVESKTRQLDQSS